LTDFRKFCKLVIGYENDSCEQLGPVSAVRSALFWSRVFFAGESVSQNNQLKNIQNDKTLNSGKKPEFLFFGHFPFSFFRDNFYL